MSTKLLISICRTWSSPYFQLCKLLSKRILVVATLYMPLINVTGKNVQNGAIISICHHLIVLTLTLGWNVINSYNLASFCDVELGRNPKTVL